MATKVIMPQLGESVVEGTITKWLVQEGDAIKRYDPLLEVSSDKVDTEVPSPRDGVVLKLLVPEGKTVQAGTLIALLGESGEAVEDIAPASAPEPAQAPAPAKPAPDTPAPASPQAVGFISPVVARLAAEHQVDLTQVQGSGVRGRIRKKDILAYIEQQKSQPDVPEWEKPGSGELFKPTSMEDYAPVAAPVPAQPLAAGDQTMPLSRMRQLIAQHMVLSRRTSPHVGSVFMVDLTNVVQHRYANKKQFAQDGANLTFTAYFVSAVAQALKKHPYANSSWSEQGIVLRRAINIGMATAIDDGLIVPVIKSADSYNLLGLARMVNDLAARARAGQLKPDEIKEATFTITNHGTGGSLMAAPIINQPNAGILGVGAIHKEPVVISSGHPLLPDANDTIAIRPVTYLSFYFDHRILDGASADAFVAEIKRILENWV